MPDLREQLRQTLRGRVCLVGVGNVQSGDDGLGVRLAGALAEWGRPGPRGSAARARHPDPGAEEAARPVVRAGAGRDAVPDPPPQGALGPRPSTAGWDVLVAGSSPERAVGRVAAGGYDTVLFLDAVEFGAAPGSVALFDSGEMLARYPQGSTHRLSLGLMARLIESNRLTRVWLLGMQPASLRAGPALSAPVRVSLAMLAQIIADVAPGGPRAEEDCALRAAVREPAGIPGGSLFRVPDSPLPC